MNQTGIQKSCEKTRSINDINPLTVSLQDLHIVVWFILISIDAGVADGNALPELKDCTQTLKFNLILISISALSTMLPSYQSPFFFSLPHLLAGIEGRVVVI